MVPTGSRAQIDLDGGRRTLSSLGIPRTSSGQQDKPYTISCAEVQPPEHGTRVQRASIVGAASTLML